MMAVACDPVLVPAGTGARDNSDIAQSRRGLCGDAGLSDTAIVP
jgi:hypothetical protein